MILSMYKLTNNMEGMFYLLLIAQNHMIMNLNDSYCYDKKYL